MRDRRVSYVHRGDALRRRRRLIRLALGVAGCMTFLVAYENQNPAEAKAAAPTGEAGPLAAASAELSATLGEVTLASDELEMWHRIYAYSSRYGIGSQLARAIHDIAIEEGIEPELAFRLVRLESEFKPRATSPVGAIGLTQVMPATARYFQKGISRDELYDRDTNLRIGFRYLRALIRENDGDVRLALLVYNRGPAAVARSRAEGVDPSNGYDRIVMKGYNGKGVID